MPEANPKSQPVWPFILMLIWYGCLMMIGGGMFLLGLAFGSEAYRSNPMPITEWLIISGPLIASTAFMIATIYLWNKRKHQAAYALCGISITASIGIIAIAGVLGI